MEYYGFENILAALRFYCREEAGRAVIGENLRTVILKNLADPAGRKAALRDRCLTVHAAFGRGAAGQVPEAEIREAIEKALG